MNFIVKTQCIIYQIMYIIVTFMDDFVTVNELLRGANPTSIRTLTISWNIAPIMPTTN